MSFSNSTSRYGGVARGLHWLTALLILSVIPLGIIANDMAHEIRSGAAEVSQGYIDRAVFLFSLHKTIGVTIFFVALLRILWALSQPKPVPLHPERRLETILAETVHWLFYGSLLLVPATGWIHHAATTGFAPIWWPFGQSLPFVPKDDGVAELFAGLHIVFERVLVVSLLLHIAGALKHALIDRDATLARMLAGRDAAPARPERPGHALPIVGAVSAWAIALVLGTALGVLSLPDRAAQAEGTRAQADTGWQVQDGRLGISVTQMGSTIDGSFAQWSAAIAYAPDADGPDKGEVTVEIDISSLTLGSVTSQAMGADFFDEAAHPSATFSADILDEDGLVARGTLTLKGAQVPVELPFTLEQEGDATRMRASLTLDRRDFGIGAGVQDAATLGFEVGVEIDLTATRAPD